ncbi:MAG: RraA family protein [Clostridia bacterium]|nr:RraA family protein [Clostridia bacterium]
MLDLSSDKKIFEMMKKYLYTAVVGDIMDKMGMRHQFLPQNIRPLRDDMVIAGRAMTVLESDIENVDMSRFEGKSFGMMLEALDDLKEDEIYFCSGSSMNYAVLGELMTTRIKYLGAAGAVVNGYLRDTNGILALDIPVFSAGCYAQDQAPRGVVVDFRVPLDVGEVHIESGDILFGDIDGVLVIPRAHEKEILQAAYEKATGEKTVGTAIKNGMSVVEAFAKYGIM